MKKILTLLLLTFLLISCWEEEIAETKTEKQDFIVQTKKLNDFSGEYEIKKTWKIKSSQEIVLTSKASWRVSRINVKFWDKVNSWKNLINLSDNTANYWLNLEKTNLAIESSILNYESTKISLDKVVEDLKINLDKLEKDYKNLINTNKKTLIWLNIRLEQSKVWTRTTTTSSLQIDKLKTSIEKTKFDLEKLKKSNLEQIKSFETTSKNDYLNLKNLYSDVINFWDNLLWVTTLNKRNNDKFEGYLGKKNTVLLNKTKTELRELIKYNEEKIIKFNSDNININNLENISKLANEWYPKIITFLDNIDWVIDNSIENIYFSRTQIDWYKNQIVWKKSNASWKYNAFLNFKSSTEKFLNTYKNNEKSLEKQIEILNKDLELLVINTKVSEKQTEISLDKTKLQLKNWEDSMLVAIKTAKLNLENAIKNRNITLKQLNNSIALSKNTKNLAYKEYSKLFISSPISGVVSEVLVDKWQDVNPGTPLIKLSSLWKNEVEIWLSFWETEFIKIWDKVEINYLWKKLKWTISAISKIADQNLNYKTRISINSEVNISWNIVEVIIPVKIWKKLISLKNMKVQSENIWEINVIEASEIKKVLVTFWKFYWDSVEIVWCKDLEKKECDNLEIITNDVTRFDKNKFKIIKK